MIGRVVVRGSSRRLRLASSFGLSGAFHGLLLAWLVWASATAPTTPPPTMYELAVKPYEKHIVWYSLSKKLPDVRPAEASANQQPPRARHKFDQSIVSGKKDDARAPQKIVMPAPAIELPKPLPLPNMVAVKETSRVRTFVPPVSAGQPSTAAPVLPEAPRMEANVKAKPLDVPVTAVRPTRPFTPPPLKPSPVPTATAPVVLPEAPQMTVRSNSVTLPVGIPAIEPRRTFTLPPATPRPPASEPADPSTPELLPATPLSASMPRIPRGFVAPPSKAPDPTPAPGPLLEAPPVLGATPTPGATATLAIAGLAPTRSLDIPPPPGSHDASFSAGVKPESSKADGAVNEAASITVPGLATRGGGVIDRATTVAGLAGPNPRQSLLAALREPIPKSVMTPAPTVSHAARVASAPDARLTGRFIYMMAIQMPNVTSYSGSWIVWFAEHQPEPGEAPGEMRPPVAVHKVDPKYIQSAAEERVEGMVRLAAVIRRTGHVDGVELLQHLDARLDRSAEEALAKWEFEPAQHNGTPVDIDAVFEIPFRLAPKPKR